MAESKLLWAVEFDATGRATRCERIFAVGADSERCYVVEARSRDGAIEKASKLYKSRQKALLRMRRDRYEADGKCRCGRPRDESGYKYCRACRHAQKVYDGTYRNRGPVAKRASPKPADPITPPGEAIARTRRSTKQMARLQALLDVQQWWADAATPEDFGRRVASEIRLLTERGYDA